MEQKFQQPPRKQKQLKFPVHISHGLQPVDGNIIILTKYFTLCMNIQRASVAFSLQDWHILLLPKNVYMMLQSPRLGGVELSSLNHVISDILEESLVQCISLCVITFMGVSTKKANVRISSDGLIWPLEGKKTRIQIILDKNVIRALKKIFESPHVVEIVSNCVLKFLQHLNFTTSLNRLYHL